ncbi:MAG: hypothetical protein OEY37_08705 [Gammaproteobacteria bacterium]|nr:hypothetical protein [Gammaproteobacteria bacterium]
MQFQRRHSLPGSRALWRHSVVAICLMTCGLWALPARAQQPVPELPAFLPMAHTVPQGAVTPIDGEWVVTSIGKRIRIQAGRAYAVDSWLHMFVLRIQPMMVVLKDIRRTQPGHYTGQDLPLMGAWNARLGPDGTLSVNVQGALGPAQYTLMPVSQDDPQAFAEEKRGNYQPGGSEEKPAPADDDDGNGEEVYEGGPNDEEEW